MRDTPMLLRQGVEVLTDQGAIGTEEMTVEKAIAAGEAIEAETQAGPVTGKMTENKGKAVNPVGDAIGIAGAVGTERTRAANPVGDAKIAGGVGTEKTEARAEAGSEREAGPRAGDAMTTETAGRSPNRSRSWRR